LDTVGDRERLLLSALIHKQSYNVTGSISEKCHLQTSHPPGAYDSDAVGKPDGDIVEAAAVAAL
jgi:hypothetical protein